jgi:ABC-type transport system substrate-binding protein
MVGKKFDIVGGWWSVTVDPDMFYSPLQHSSRRGTSPASVRGGRQADQAFRFTSNPAARKKMYPEMVRWFQEEGSIIVFSNEIQKYWMKPNVQASVPYPSLELKFEETWLA